MAGHSVGIYIATYIATFVNVAGLSAAAISAPYEYKAAGFTLCLMDKKAAPTIRDLYPHFTDEQLAEAEDAHDRYLAIVLRIFERLELEAAQLTPGTGAIPCQLPDSGASN